MSDSSRSNADPTAAAERLLSALGSAASGLATRETLNELGDRARGVVEGLARHARNRREAAEAAEPFTEPSAEPFAEKGSDVAGDHPNDGSAVPGGSAFFRGRAFASRPETEPASSRTPLVHRRLDELRACVGEVSDVLEATVERLETIEEQLGDPDEGIQKLLADGIERCERVLMGIEHRVMLEVAKRTQTGGGADAAFAPAIARLQQSGSPLVVLVVAASSVVRSRLCLAIERQGLRAVAATDLGPALAVAARWNPAVAILVLEGGPQQHAAFLDEWKDHEERGSLPLAAVLGGLTVSSGFSNIREDHGEAALAASLVRLTNGDLDAGATTDATTDHRLKGAGIRSCEGCTSCKGCTPCQG